MRDEEVGGEWSYWFVHCFQCQDGERGWIYIPQVLEFNFFQAQKYTNPKAGRVILILMFSRTLERTGQERFRHLVKAEGKVPDLSKNISMC
jgi:hypothetical protein